jgi:CHAT domain-containing protein
VGAGPLIVAMPRTPGLPDLPGADREAVLVAARRPGATTLTGAQATRAAVLAALPGHASAHFACHAYSDPDEPSRSHLVLHDHRASPLTVADVARLDLGGARLAYLSACATAESSAALPDEVVHIASAFGLAGYPDVIATLWPIADEPAVHVADGVYRGITVDGHPPALALHDAVRAMRRRFPEDPWLWAPFIHYGR